MPDSAKAIEPDEILPPAVMGRARIDIDLDQLEQLAALQCTEREIAQVLGISDRTYYYRKANDPDFAAAYNYGRNMGTVSLRKMQFDAAKRGNSAMLTLLGREYLGQAEGADEEFAATFELQVVTTGDIDDGATAPATVAEATEVIE